MNIEDQEVNNIDVSTEMQCSRMHLSERRYKLPARVSPSDSGPIFRPCLQRYQPDENSPSRRSNRTLSPQTTSSNSEGSMPESQKTPLIIINLNIAPETKTLAPKDLKRDPKKLPPFCVQYQNTVSKNYSASDNAKSANDFVVQGRLISSKRTCKNHPNGRNIVINCEEEYETCTDICTEFGESEIAGNVFNNINTDLLLTLDCYEMDNFGRLQNSRTPSPNYTQVSPLSMRSNTPTLLIPPGYRPLCIRTPSPSTRQIIRVDLTNRDISSAKSDDKMKQLNYNMNRLKEKRGRNKKPI